MCPFARSFVNGSGGLFARGRLCCHCLLVETNDGLLLVDTGIGTRDIERPVERLGRLFLLSAQPKLRREETAVERVRQLGFDPADVRHIVITHGDIDHAGGIADFPNAKVHVFSDEYEAIMDRAHRQADRYATIFDNPEIDWASHAIDGEKWMGFDTVRAIAGDDVLIVPVAGHTAGHAAVAVKRDDGWLLHAGDAYFHHRQMDPDRPSVPIGLKYFQRFTDFDRRMRVRNQERLRTLARDHAEVRVFCAHDVEELESARSSSG